MLSLSVMRCSQSTEFTSQSFQSLGIKVTDNSGIAEKRWSSMAEAVARRTVYRCLRLPPVTVRHIRLTMAVHARVQKPILYFCFKTKTLGNFYLNT